MQLDLSEVAFVIVAGTLLFLILISFLISFFVVYQKRKTKIEEERRLEREQYLREINNAQLEIREETLKFISQELHDNISQMLAVTSMALQRLDSSSPIFFETEKSLNQTIKQVRLLSKTLNTDSLLEEGFLKSLDFEVNRLKQLERWNIDYFNDVSSVNISNDKQLLLFRIFQELLNNFIKYAQASNVVIEFEERDKHYILSLTDDGNQFDFDEIVSQNQGLESGAGLRGILKRVKMLEGEITAKPNPKKGMFIKIVLPIN